MEFYYENMKISLNGYGVKLYPNLMLNKLKVTWRELALFVHYWGPNSKQVISIYFKKSQINWSCFKISQIVYKFISKYLK